MTDTTQFRFDLKVCEGCGALWLRAASATTVYCRRCATRLSAFPAPRGKRNGGRRPRLARVTHPTHAAEIARSASSAPTSSVAGGAQ